MNRKWKKQTFSVVANCFCCLRKLLYWEGLYRSSNVKAFKH